MNLILSEMKIIKFLHKLININQKLFHHQKFKLEKNF